MARQSTSRRIVHGNVDLRALPETIGQALLWPAVLAAVSLAVSDDERLGAGYRRIVGGGLHRIC